MVSTEPVAARTAGEVKFSEAISCRVVCCRSSSWPMRSGHLGIGGQCGPVGAHGPFDSGVVDEFAVGVRRSTGVVGWSSAAQRLDGTAAPVTPPTQIAFVAVPAGERRRGAADPAPGAGDRRGDVRVPPTQIPRSPAVARPAHSASGYRRDGGPQVRADGDAHEHRVYRCAGEPRS